MFSFFKSTKKSPIASPTAELQKAEDSTQRNSDEFVLIGNNNPSSPYNNRPLYPSAQLPARPPPANPQNPSFSRQMSVSTNYTTSIPFKLNQTLVATSNNDSELWGFKIREMSAAFQRISSTDYDFRLERSVLESS